jgi:hypothetical protein
MLAFRRDEFIAVVTIYFLAEMPCSDHAEIGFAEWALFGHSISRGQS